MESPFRVLLVEDNAGDARLIEEMLGDTLAPFQIAHRASRLEEAFAVVDEHPVDLVLLDLSLPGHSGIETFAKFNAHAPHVPCIVLSGSDDEELALETVHLGAQDYLSKGDCNPQLLLRSMRYAIERQRTEQALSHERDLLHSLLDNIPDRIFFKDRESRFIRVNPALAGVLQLKECHEAIGKSDLDFFSPEHAQNTVADEQHVMESAEPIVGQIEKKVLPDGRTSWTLTTKLPLKDRAGRIIGTTGISRDVTALKQMEEALSGERNLLRSVIENVPDPIYVKDADGRYILDNPAHTKFLGASDPKEVVGKTVADFFAPEVAASFHQKDQEIIESGVPIINYEELATDSKGAQRWLLTTKMPLCEVPGKIRGLVCIGRDITKQKRADEKLKQANVELSKAVADLQKAHEDLHSIQLQLIEAEKMKSIGRLAAGVAHEVKNPLAIITMGIEYLSQQKHEDDNVPGILRDLSDAVKRADDVIRGLLDFSAPRKLDLNPQDLNKIIKQSLLLIRGEMKGDKFRVVKHLQPDLQLVNLDAMKIGQVFVNVFINAVHAMGEGGTLTVRTYAKQLTGVGANIGDARSESFRVGDTVIVVEVDDTGGGVPEDKLTKVFEPFFTTKPTGKGTGLGLSVTRSIIDLHRGTIDLRNRPEGGARVTIMFKG